MFRAAYIYRAISTRQHLHDMVYGAVERRIVNVWHQCSRQYIQRLHIKGTAYRGLHIQGLHIEGLHIEGLHIEGLQTMHIGGFVSVGERSPLIGIITNFRSLARALCRGIIYRHHLGIIFRHHI